jgi:hypothetical protein
MRIEIAPVNGMVSAQAMAKQLSGSRTAIRKKTRAIASSSIASWRQFAGTITDKSRSNKRHPKSAQGLKRTDVTCDGR